MVDVIILVGGKGSRLQGIVQNVPKPLAPINGRPFLDLVLAQLASFKRVRRVVLAVGYMADSVKACYAEKVYPFELTYSCEDEPLGTGGAIRQALEMIRSDPVLVMNGDSYLGFDLSALEAVQSNGGHVMSLALTRVDDVGRYGEVDFDDIKKQVMGFKEKTNTRQAGFINGGVYLMQRAALQDFSLGSPYSFERDMLPQMVKHGVGGCNAAGKFVDIGTPESYELAQNYLKEMCGEEKI